MVESREIDRKGGSAPPISRFMAERLSRASGLGGKNLTLFQNLIARLTTSLTDGHICIELTTDQKELVRASSLVAEEMHGPLVLSGDRLYFGRYYRYESELAEALRNRAAASMGPQISETTAEKITTLVHDPHQERAVGIGLNNRFCIVSGGPGTGKTTLVVTIIRLLLAEHGPSLKIALAAPTGKAAMRMYESISAQVKPAHQIDSEVVTDSNFPGPAVTLHRLIGLGRFSNRPEFDRTNPLPYDAVIVDEASMVDLALMAKLVDALRPETRLILLGDRDQLASVESGAVLADCIDSLPDSVAILRKSYRFSAAIGELAAAVREGDAERAWALCCESDKGAVSCGDSEWLDDIVESYRRYMKKAAAEASGEGEYLPLIAEFNKFRVLCAMRRGRRGVEWINREIESRLVDLKEGLGREWYRGRPVLITRNDSSLGLFNGDVGICLPDPVNGELRVWFEAAHDALRSFLPGQLPAHETAWALTIHKSQGSEFNEVYIVLPEQDNPVLCRELLYTAITRARDSVRLVVNSEICTIAVSRKTTRHSGLADRLSMKFST